MKTTYPHFHFRPKKNWINDPNGTIYHNGFYHIFYQYNPTSDCWGNLHWGHARTKDFINYEVLKDNIHPQKELNEMDCYSGCLAINKDNKPIALYTSVAENNEIDPNIQKAVFFDDNIEHFEKDRINAIATDIENLPQVRGDLRDPYVFTADNRYFLVLGAAVGDKQTPSVLLFESEDGSLVNWKYIKELVTFKPIIELFECPNFFSLNDKWVLVGSPYREVEYYIGTFDVDNLDFTIEKSGLVDYCAQYYATNTIIDDKGRTILFAFVRGFSKNQGWNNVISIPREISLNDNMELIQLPIEETYKLRQDKLIDNQSFDLSHVVQYEDDNLYQSEVNFKINLKDDFKINLILRAKKQGVVQILFSSTGVKFDNIFIPFDKREEISVKLLIDHSVLEIFLNDGRQCATRVIEALKDLELIEFRGNGLIKNLTAYKMGKLNIKED